MNAIDLPINPSVDEDGKSTAGKIRVRIEKRLAELKGKRVNISGPAYKIVSGVAAHIDGTDIVVRNSTVRAPARSYSMRGLLELQVVLRECQLAVEEGIYHSMRNA